MAAYAYAISLDQRVRERYKSLGVLTGSLTVSNYNAANAEITELSKAFKTNIRVIFDTSTTGFIFTWTGTSVKAWAPTSAGAGAATEASINANVGTVNFIAMGLI